MQNEGDGLTGADRIGPAELLAALAGPREGRIYELATELGEHMPQGPRASFYGFRVTQYRTPKSLAGLEQPGFDFSMEMITGSPHVGTHIDGLAHIQSHGRTYGGHAVKDVYTDFGWSVNGMEHSKPIVGRGVLLDVAGSAGVDCLPDRYEITPQDLQRTIDAQRTELRTGDSILVRTGWFAARYRSNPDAYFASQPGVGPDAGVWLYERGMALLGTDTSGTEVIPHPDLERTTHKVLIVDRGVCLIEILDLDALARDQVYAFLFVCLPLRIVGGTGSWVRPIAVI
jgi:kynurenine formamidase